MKKSQINPQFSLSFMHYVYIEEVNTMAYANDNAVADEALTC